MRPFDICEGDVLEVMADLPSDHFHGMLTDPPYGLSFMGRDWDSRVPGPDVWAETLRVLKPGAHALVFGGTRTWHRLAVALEDAGFELRDTLMWLYGSGFPKSHDVSKAIDDAAGAEREVTGRVNRPGKEAGTYGAMEGNNVLTAPATPEAERWDGYGTALKPAWEPVLLVRKTPAGTVAATAVRHGTGGLNIDGARIGAVKRVPGGISQHKSVVTYNGGWGDGEELGVGGHDPNLGRWPANVIHDGSDEATRGMPETDGGAFPAARGPQQVYGNGNGLPRDVSTPPRDMGDFGNASRYFYAAKASREEREAGLQDFAEVSGGAVTGRQPGSAGAKASAYAGTTEAARRNTHPTVKPIDLCRYLALLIRPPEGAEARRILVPFSGSGSEMIGALKAGWDHATGIERDAEYARIAAARLKHHTAQPLLFAPEAP